MDPRVAWVLNLDAEDELLLGRRYAGMSPSVRARTEALIGAHLGDLVAPGDLVIDPALRRAHEGARAAERGTEARAAAVEPGPLCGRAWCPTPAALARLVEAGVEPPRAPSFEVLRRVNHRSFSAELGLTLEGAAFVRTAAEVEALLGGGEGTWVLKRPLSFAGRGHRRVEAGEPSAADRAWIAASLRGGEGVLAEPWEERVLDAALHGYLEEDGRLHLGAPTVQRSDARGAWQGSRIAEAGELDPAEARALEEEARRAARALATAGYFGAFGLDAFRFRSRGGGVAFQPRSEINARYTMGWAIGMRGFRAPAGAP